MYSKPMELLIDWGGFIGAWLLVIGSIYQAALELDEQDLEVDRIRATGEKVPHVSPTSVWWWLLPPVKLFLERRRRNQYRRAYFAALDPVDIKAMIDFMNKAIGWLLVALGGFLLACKETFELLLHYGESLTLFVIIVIGMALLALAHTIVRVKLTKRAISRPRQ